MGLYKYILLLSIIFLSLNNLDSFKIDNMNNVDKNVEKTSLDTNKIKKKQLENAPVPIPQKLDLNWYNIKITVDENNASATGYLNFTVLNKMKQNLNTLYFNLYPNALMDNSIVINRISNSSNDDINYIIENKMYLKVDLPVEVALNDRYTINIDFTTYLPFDEDRFGYQNKTGKTIYSFTHWYPLLAVFEDGAFVIQPYINYGESFFADMGYYTVNVKLNKSLVVASGGYLERNTSDSVYQYLNYSFSPAREFTLVVSPDFIVAKDTVNNIDILSYYFAGNEERGLLALKTSINSLNLFSEVFEPYPYKTMSIVNFIFNFGGMEYSGLVLIADNYYDPTQVPIFNFDLVLSHEWAHTWNTYIAANNPYLDPWLDESWAMYAFVLYLEEFYNENIADYFIDSIKNFVIGTIHDGINGQNSYPPFNIPLGLGMEFFVDPLNTPTFGTTIYYKGMIIIDILRNLIGDEAFFKAIVDFYDSFSYKIVDSVDFVNIFELSSGLELSWFFDAYLEEAIFIDELEIKNTIATLSNDENNNGILNYEFTINKKSNVTLPIQVPILISVLGSDNHISNHFIWVNESEQIISDEINLSKGIKNYNTLKITIDPDWMLLRDSGNITTSITLEKDQSSSSPISSSEDPVPTTSFYFELTTLLSLMFILKVDRRRKQNR